LLEGLAAEGANVVNVLVDSLPQLTPAYSKYCSGIPTAQGLYEKKMTKKDFIAFEKSFETLNKPTLNYIMRPVQVRPIIMSYCLWCS
jgi:hypothetical protein